MKEAEVHLPRILLFDVTDYSDFPIDFSANYHTHIYCHRGDFSFLFNEVTQQCSRGEFVFWFAKSNLSNFSFSQDFKATVLLIENRFLTQNLPDQSWSVDATLHSRRFPVLQLHQGRDKKRVLENFKLLFAKYEDQDHRFYEEGLRLQMQLFILEMWHTFANEYERRKSGLQVGSLYERFIHLVEDHCVKQREIKFYANKLNVTAKHLNYVCKQNSGITASDWVQRYTKERIILLLQNKNLNIAEISDEMEFSSRSFFTRYVKKVLGVTPTAYRNRFNNQGL